MVKSDLHQFLGGGVSIALRPGATDNAPAIFISIMGHTFHIPVLGLGYSVDTPLKVSRYGISSVISIVDDELIERMREYHTKKLFEAFREIPKTEPDSRAKRITAYLNLVDRIIDGQFEELKQQPFVRGNDICRYFELLPETSQLRQGYDLMLEYPDGEQKQLFQQILRGKMTKGAIDVNIMSKVDKMNFTSDGEYTGDENTDALAALKGYAQSTLQSSVIMSAGMNPKLYSHFEKFPAFFPDQDGVLQKKIILKVSDFRSAFIQAKFLAKKRVMGIGIPGGIRLELRGPCIRYRRLSARAYFKRV